ncbi:acyl-CoA dehydrogenase domain-containing protein [Mycolicibacterium rhodesiae JS60]|nr:acyl-CoA dehydrogenase domain-containing protein [Mycolicibacterium rhodesiae JS60]
MSSDLQSFARQAEDWLAQHLPRRVAGKEQVGPDDVAVFHNLTHDHEARLVADAAAWQAQKWQAGYGAIDWPSEFGGLDLTAEHARLFGAIEAGFEVPADHELRRITTNLVAPTLRKYGSAAQIDQLMMDLLSCRQLTCQLFSEPGAGSDLAGLATRAVRATDNSWIINGSKVWVSGAQFADWGLLIARTDPDVPKHAGLTAFLVPMNSPGLEVRPIRQMSGGTSFNEIFFTDVRVPDGRRLGPLGAGWQVTLTMLAFERNQSGSKAGVGGSWEQLLMLARLRERTTDPVVAQELVNVYIHERVRELTRRRAAQARAIGSEVGPEGSLGKLLWAQGLTAIGNAAAQLLGPDILADTGESGTYAWASHLLGAPGFRIAGGSDEIQRNIIAERVLGLPPEPRVDTGVPWRELRSSVG